MKYTVPFRRKNPYCARKLPGSRFYRVTGGRGRVHAKRTSRKKARAQVRLLRGLKNPIPKFKQWFSQALSAFTQGQTENEFVAHAHPANRGMARRAYRDVVAHFHVGSAEQKARKNPAKRPRREKVLVVYPKLDAMLGTTPGQELISKAEALRRGLRVEDEDESRMKQNPARRTTPARRRRAAQIASRDAQAAGSHVLLIHRPGKYFYTMVGSRSSLLTKVRLAFGKKFHYFTGELAAWILSAKKGERKNLHGNRLAFK